MSAHEMEQFLATWDWEAKKTAEVLRSLPLDRYDFRADPKGRSVGEMAWHLAEVDGYMSSGVAEGRFDVRAKLPGLERPRAVAELAPGYERVHHESVERVKKLKPEDWDREVPFFDGSPMRIREILWYALLHHLIHHRGQLVLMCRLAGGTPPDVYGPNRENSVRMMEAAKARG